MLPNSHRIPLEIAHRFLATFGVTEPTKEYERWIKDDGFDFEDFPTVLSDSPFIFLVDWRAALEDELALIVPALARLDAVLEYQIDPETSRGTVTCDGKTQQVKFVPSDNDDFTAVIMALQLIVPPSIEFRGSPLNGEMDQWDFAVLRSDEWAELEALDAELVTSLFSPVP